MTSNKKILKKRTANFNEAEEKLILELVVEEKSIIECKKSGHYTWKQKDNAWERIISKFNALSSAGVLRDKASIIHKYKNLKKTTKAKMSANRANIKGTGGGPSKIVPPNDIDLTIEDILDEEQIYGLGPIFDSDEVQVTGVSDEVQTTEKEDASSQEVRDFQSTSSAIAEGENLVDNHGIVNTDWSEYTPTMLKQPINKKLRTPLQERMNRRAKRLTINKTSNDRLVEEKLEFVRFQKEKFTEEHDLKMQILRKKLELKEKKLKLLEKENL